MMRFATIMNMKNGFCAPVATKTARGWTANIHKFRVAKAAAPHRHVYTSHNGLVRLTFGLAWYAWHLQ